MNNKQLYRSNKDKVLGGVAGGLADYLNVDPVLIRAVFIILVLANMSGVVIYLILWLILPSEESLGVKNAHLVRDNASEIREKANEFSGKFQEGDMQNKSRMIIGGVIIFFGLMALLKAFGLPNLLDWGLMWPLVLVIVGFVILLKKD